MTVIRGRALAIAVVAGLFLPLTTLAAVFSPTMFDSPAARGVWQTDLLAAVVVAAPFLLLVAVAIALACAASPRRAWLRAAVAALLLPFVLGAGATLVFEAGCGGEFACGRQASR